MRQDLAIGCAAVVVVASIVFIVMQLYRGGSGGTADGIDEFASPGDAALSVYSCGDLAHGVTSRNIFEQSNKLAGSLGSGGIQTSDRTALIQWRARRNQNLKKRPGASDLAPFDALRPAYDAMCRSVEMQSECFRSVESSSSSSSKNLPAWASAVRKQVRLWSPSTSAFMQRPTLLCVSMVAQPDRIEMALAQWRLWGANCDDFYIAVQMPTADSTMVWNATADKMRMRQRYAGVFRRAGLQISKLWVVRPLVSWRIQDKVRYDRWQAFRELSRVMGEEDLSHPVYMAEYTMFVREDTYVVPENVFGFLSSPEVRHLESISTPTILGHVLQVPPPSDDELNEMHQQHEHDPGHHHQPSPKTREGHGGDDEERRIFASFDGGMIWNRVTRKLFMNAVRAQDACAFANTEADDVVLSDCFRFYGIQPVDTADTRGADRQHILRPEWAMTVGRDPHLVEWYSLFRGRPSLQGVAALSPSTMTFGGLENVEDMETLHAALAP